MINNQSFSIRCCDPDRIQTCNLLIRSQMLYSVEPRGLSLNCDAKVRFWNHQMFSRLFSIKFYFCMDKSLFCMKM